MKEKDHQTAILIKTALLNNNITRLKIELNKGDQKIANDVNENGSVRLGDEVFVYSKSYNWKVQDLRNFINWIVEKSNNSEELIDSLLAIMGATFVPKLKGLDAVSANRNLNPEMIRDTFLYKEWKEKADLKTININNKSAPNWTKDLKHSERKK